MYLFGINLKTDVADFNKRIMKHTVRIKEDESFKNLVLLLGTKNEILNDVLIQNFIDFGILIQDECEY